MGVWKTFEVPEAFGVVETGIYRSSLPNEEHFEFLKTLSLKTMLFLSQEILVKSLRTFLDSQSTQIINLGLNLNHHPHTLQRGMMAPSSWKHCREEIIQEALNVILNRETHPVMIVCTSGVHITGTVVGCLRRVQNWSLTSVLDEYECYAGKRSRYSNQQFIELFGPDLVPLAKQHLLPVWLVTQRDLMRKEREELLQDRHSIITKSSEIELNEKDTRLAFQVYYYCEDGPLISKKSTYTEASVVEEEED